MSCTIFSTFFVVQPFAITNCSTPLKVKEGDDVVCLCNSKGGNPAPTASWYKNGIVVNGAGHSKNLLFLKNMSRNDNWTYSCVVKSLALSNATQVVIEVQCKLNINMNADCERTILHRRVVKWVIEMSTILICF